LLPAHFQPEFFIFQTISQGRPCSFARKGEKSHLKLAAICVAFVICGALAHAADERPAPAAPVALPTNASGQPAPPAADARIATSSSAAVPVFSSLPDAPAVTLTTTAPPPSAIIKLKPRPTTHRFFDTTNTLALSSVAAGLTADALSTQKGLSYPGFYEMNPLARPFVSSRAGAAAYSAGSFGLLAGAMYVAHRTHHHKLERILPFAVAGWEGLLSARNYHVIAAGTR
jgi:hypothetical protein